MEKGHRVLIVVLLIAVLALGGCATPSPSGTDAEAPAIAAVLDDYVTFAEAGDAESWLALWDEGGVQMPPNAPERTKQQLDELMPTMMKNRNAAMEMEMNFDIVETEIAGPWAYIRCGYTQEFTNRSNGEESLVDGKALTVFRRQADGSWLIYRDCFNSNVAP